MLIFTYGVKGRSKTLIILLRRADEKAMHIENPAFTCQLLELVSLARLWI